MVLRTKTLADDEWCPRHHPRLLKRTAYLLPESLHVQEHIVPSSDARTTVSPTGHDTKANEKKKQVVGLVDVGEKGTVFGKPRRDEELGTEAPSLKLAWRDLKDNNLCCPVSKNINECWTVPLALPPNPQMTSSPVTPRPTHLRVRNDKSYGSQPAMWLVHPRFPRETHCRRLCDVDCCWTEERSCSASKTISG
jgi:hypothetical protein